MASTPSSAPVESSGEIQRGQINKVTAKYGFITVGERGVFFSFDLLPPGWRPSVGDEVECIPILSKQVCETGVAIGDDWESTSRPLLRGFPTPPWGRAKGGNGNRVGAWLPRSHSA